MSQSQLLIINYFEALQAQKDVSAYENTISDMIYNFVNMDFFYKLPVVFLSRIFKNTQEIYMNDDAKYILLMIQKQQKKDVSKIIENLDRVLTPDQLADAIKQIENCEKTEDEELINKVDSMEKPKFPISDPPDYVKLLERRNEAILNEILTGYAKNLVHLRDEITDAQDQINDAPHELKEAQENAEAEIVEEVEKIKKEEEEEKNKLDKIKSEFQKIKIRLSRNEQQNNYYLEFVRQQDDFENDKAKINEKLNTEVISIRKKIDQYLDIQKQQKIKEKAQRLGKTEEEMISMIQNQVSEQYQEKQIDSLEQAAQYHKETEDNKYLEEEEDEIDDEYAGLKEISIPENVEFIKPTQKPKDLPKPTKIRTIWDAIYLQDVDAVNDFLTKKPNLVFEKGENRTTTLIEAVRTGNLPIVKLLTENGADPNMKDVLGNNAFHIAAQTQNAAIVSYFIEIKADSNITDREGRKPIDILTQREEASKKLYDACQKGNLREMGDVLRVWPDMVNIKFKGDITPLHISVGNNYRKFTEKLLVWGANLDPLDYNGNTPLHYSVIFNSPQAGQFILNHGARYDIKNKDGKTAFELKSQ